MAQGCRTQSTAASFYRKAKCSAYPKKRVSGAFLLLKKGYFKK